MRGAHSRFSIDLIAGRLTQGTPRFRRHRANSTLIRRGLGLRRGPRAARTATSWEHPRGLPAQLPDSSDAAMPHPRSFGLQRSSESRAPRRWRSQRRCGPMTVSSRKSPLHLGPSGAVNQPSRTVYSHSKSRIERALRVRTNPARRAGVCTHNRRAPRSGRVRNAPHQQRRGLRVSPSQQLDRETPVKR